MSRKVFVSSDMGIDERLSEVAEVDGAAALLWPWLLTALDDWGRCEASPRRLKARCFPTNELVTSELIERALLLYERVGLVVLYEVDGRRYLAVDPDKWWRYQTHIRREKREVDASRIPAPPRDCARDRAQVRDFGTKSVPSPSPSPSPSSPPSSPPSEANASSVGRVAAPPPPVTRPSSKVSAPRNRAITETDLQALEAEFPGVDVRAAAADYLNWSGSSKHRDQVLGLRNQLRLPRVQERFARTGWRPEPRASPESALLLDFTVPPPRQRGVS